MGLLRSEDMKHGTLVLPVDRARAFVNLIGFRANIQFEDMNHHDLHRPYKKYVQRVDEMERILRFLRDEILRVPGWHEDDIKTGNIDAFLATERDYALDEVEGNLKKLYGEFVQFRENMAKLIDARNRILEERFVADVAAAFQSRRVPHTDKKTDHRGLHSVVGHRGEDDDEFSDSQSLLRCNSERSLKTVFTNTAGVILQSDQDRFAWALFRATRGNTFTHFQQINEPILDPQTSKEVMKSVFVIYYQNLQVSAGVSAMAEKIKKICGSFGVQTYPWYETEKAAQAAKAHLSMQYRDQEQLLEHLRHYMRAEATTLVHRTSPQGNSLIEDWRLFCVKEKAIYATLNLFEGRMNLRASCWYPAQEEYHIKQVLVQADANAGAMLVSDRSFSRKLAPTYIRTNELTEIAQQLVDTYGFPRYKEANPMLFTVVTFPFLFGIMYGDVGHGAMLLLLGLWIVWHPEQFQKTAPVVYAFRYMLTMMGAFAVYAGLLYNDFFSIGLFIFDSRWNLETPQRADGAPRELEPLKWFDHRNTGAGYGPYPFGLDPAWRVASNELMFVNSMKMKLSVVVGVAHMTAGLLLRWCNAFYERSSMEFVGECLPMMVFMLCFFGFMDFMILYKWVTPLENPPSIINSLIAMALGSEDKAPMFGPDLPGRLMFIVILTVPWMLFYKPFVLWRRHQQRPRRSFRPAHHHHQHRGEMVGFGSSSLDEEEKAGLHDIEDEEEEFEFGEVMIHQVIETIEFVLGTVSHTASYLRLWALSLAHQQLSMVFFQKTLLVGMEVSFPWNGFAIYIAFAMWLGITVGILLMMDVLECFLHTLRLHWVEFQSKFYKADGHKFVPFRHKTLLEEATA